MSRTIEVAVLAFVLLVVGLALHAWLTSRDAQLRLQAALAAQKQLLDAADARERHRNASLNNTLTQIEALKRATQTPEQILHELPNYLPLPQPLTMTLLSDSIPPRLPATAPSENPPPKVLPSSGITQQGTDECLKTASGSTCQDPNPNSPVSSHLPSGTAVHNPYSSTSAEIPAVDLKPLYDYVQDCRACQTQLATAKLDAADNATKIAALMRERDAALTTAKGGGFWQRLRRDIVWFAVGTGAGAVAVCGMGHCRP